MSRVLGIDLGSAHSVAAALRDGAKPFVTRSGLVPSYVAYPTFGAALVGAAAREHAVRDPAMTLRLDPQRAADPDLLVRIATRLLRKLREDAEAQFGEPINDAVIAVPVTMFHTAREMLRLAAERAGITVLRLISAPAAAALAYGLGHPEAEERLLIVDLGAGTLDTAVVEVGDGVVEVLATAGDPMLGGDDFDQRIVGYLLNAFRAQHHIDVSTDPVAVLRVAAAAEQARRDLTAREATPVRVPYLVGTTPLDVTVERAQFQQATADLVERLAAPIRRAIEDAGAAPDRVLLVGGATRMPAVAAKIAELTGLEPSHALHPDEAVAHGAALQGGILTGAIPNVLLLDVTTMDIGTSHDDGTFTTIVPRNTTLPALRTTVYTTAVDDQADLALTLHERAAADDVPQQMLTAEVGDLPGGPAGSPQLAVTLDVDANGVFSITARDGVTGRELPIKLS
ncbi:Hsp70 family protein [Virgisporangium aliadipatigenens]|uniref:Hsp70 family protein n=1 Tax=Virgisporangium aliadipatigenens TaxID=741659 RepID=UPI001941B865|nr:Hsp70 family protein [Virgisporangium aliadipatigenens]